METVVKIIPKKSKAKSKASSTSKRPLAKVTSTLTRPNKSSRPSKIKRKREKRERRIRPMCSQPNRSPNQITKI